jgi:NADPH:quinone reductase-like Zn-dependent oxidoreductase
LKAAVLKNDMDMVFEDVPSPAPGEEQVLIRVKWSSRR